MPAVAKAAGGSLPTVYRYFSDKKALTDAAARPEAEFAAYAEKLFIR